MVPRRRAHLSLCIALSACAGDDAKTATTAAATTHSSATATATSSGSTSAEPTSTATATTASTSAAETGAASTSAAATSSGASSTDSTAASTSAATTDAPPACPAYVSEEEEFAPVQIVGEGLPAGAARLAWSLPAISTYTGPFAGTPGKPASHEGIDYVHGDEGVPVVQVLAAAAGEVVYVRLGCPQSQLFGSNTALRECGSGWGNHVVVDHGGGVFTRYAHLHPDGVSVKVGDAVARGDHIADMGNSGRSDQRHLHFELASHAGTLDPCAPAQSLDRVHDPAALPFE